MRVEHWDPRSDGPFTAAALRRKLEAMGYEVSTYAYPPGTRFGDHTHEVDKVDAVLAGTFRITVRGQPALLRPGDWLFVPQGVEHSAEVVGDETVVSLDAARRD